MLNPGAHAVALVGKTPLLVLSLYASQREQRVAVERYSAPVSVLGSAML